MLPYADESGEVQAFGLFRLVTSGEAVTVLDHSKPQMSQVLILCLKLRFVCQRWPGTSMAARVRQTLKPGSGGRAAGAEPGKNSAHRQQHLTLRPRHFDDSDVVEQGNGGSPVQRTTSKESTPDVLVTANWKVCCCQPVKRQLIPVAEGPDLPSQPAPVIASWLRRGIGGCKDGVCRLWVATPQRRLATTAPWVVSQFQFCPAWVRKRP